MRSKAQIYHILMRKTCTNSLRKCKAYSSLEIDLDHRIVTPNIEISLRIPENNQKALF